MKKIFTLGAAILLGALLLSSCGKTYTYQTVPNDPLKARIYTLDNGLKVYLTVYKDAPRIQTYIPVRVGGKNDPAETTGLAHYFEHLMFKGTKSFGTQSYEAEKPYLDSIEALFEQHRATADEAERRAIYKEIDSLSQLASQYAIPNEYDKLMAAIGASGTNAYTSEDVTCYTDDIPSNEIENWAKIQADRFTNAVIRGFHTELETVYEEYNMYLTRDTWKVIETLFSSLFPFHPYGTQTVLGTQEHLKNPSITNIKNYYNTYYVANNMAVCLSGDFDPDKTIRIIDKYFGKLRSNPNIPTVKVGKETAISSPIKKEVLGNDPESLWIGWRLPGAKAEEAELCQLMDYILLNGKAGLIDLNITQKQRTLSASGGYYGLSDYGMFYLTARPKQGQTLAQAKSILLEQIDLLKKGEFEEWLLQATINNFKLHKMQQLEHNSVRAQMFVDAFTNGADWATYATRLDRMSSITKQQIVDFANKYFANGYIEVHKLTGKDPNEKKIEKPTITPIKTNRDAESALLAEVKSAKVKPIEPVFLDFEKDLDLLQAKQNIPVLYKQNVENDRFEMSYIFEMGTKSDKVLGLAFSYLQYLGTSQYTPEQIKSEFYKLACSFSVWSSENRVYASISGLSANMEKAVALLEALLADPQVNNEAFKNLIVDTEKKRADAKLVQGQIFGMLRNYAEWGAKSPATNVLTSAELKRLKPQELTARVKDLRKYQHRISYYGPMEKQEFLALIDKQHSVAESLQPVIPAQKFEEQMTKENTVLFAPYDAKQIYFAMISKRGEKFDDTKTPIIKLYNEYFGGGMSSIVFQEMREARGLAYSAGAGYSQPSRLDQSCTFSSFIATQNDKMDDAVKAFHEIINEMPESQNAFDIAKESMLTNLRTQRTTKSGVIWSYIYTHDDLGLNYDRNQQVFEKVQGMTLADVKKFQEENVKGRAYTYCILGNEKDLDFKTMATYGKVQKLKLEDIFGY
ncbi:MAG: insulinase family protein [Prevotellaceae bacterium]|jgi:predicted Zn-dependent peptidase|nr:insulinase family protein [Prevotellaceae bacterium]